MTSLSRRELGWFHLHQVRVGAGVLGVAALLGLGVTGHSALRVPFTGIAVVALASAAVALAIEARRARPSQPDDAAFRVPTSGDGPFAAVTSRPGPHAARWPGWRAAVGVFVIAAAATQTWFTSGTVLAGGDIAPPIGTAWLAKLFDPWVWSGSNLGAPNTLASQLPWAVVDAVVHALGGSGALADRLWLSALFVGAALAAYWLLRVLGVAPVASAVGGLVYVFNPFVVSLGMNDVFLAALVPVAAWPAVVISVATGQWRRRAGLLAFVASAPLAGFVYSNPPLLGLAAAATVVGALASMRLFGRRVARRATIAVLGGMAALAAASAYWLVPAVAELHNVSSGLPTTSSWAWTEGRASVANGLWLNTTWGWKYPAYYPYAHLYDQLPLSLLKFALPAIAFSSLALVRPAVSPSSRRRAQLVAGAALVSLVLIVAGTGTNLPGAIIFDPLYHLPLGWLLQAPGRFLMAAGLGYGAMAAVTVQCAAQALSERQSRTASPAGHRTVAHLRRRLAGGFSLLALSVATVGLAAAVSFPIAVGTLAGYHAQAPATHVRVPRYWEALASSMNRRSSHATVLVLPPDDFYQMPYTWGYYGNDGFISALLAGRVLDPAGQGYTPGSAELLQADDQMAAALLAHDWQTADDLAGALGIDEVLVRGDVDAHYPGRQIVSPAALAAALGADPDAHLIDRAGPLIVYRLNAPGPKVLATVDTTKPDLAVLAQLPPSTALVSGPPRRGSVSVLQPPSLASWSIVDGALQIKINEPAGWHYRTAVLPALSSNTLKVPLARVSTEAGPATSSGTRTVQLRLPLGRSVVADGTFTAGLWGPIGDCYAVAHPSRPPDLKATVVDGAPLGGRVLRLNASADRACEAETLHWHHGTVLLSLLYRSPSGSAAGVCVWQAGPDSCAPLPTLSEGSGWHRVQAKVTPPAGTTALGLFLYATPDASTRPAVAEYANVAAYTMTGVGQPVLIGTPEGARSSTQLVVGTSTYGSAWQGPAGSRKVRVDGLRNGWELTSRTRPDPGRRLHYASAVVFATADDVSVIVGSVALVLILLMVARGWRGRLRRRPRTGAPALDRRSPSSESPAVVAVGEGR